MTLDINKILKGEPGFDHRGASMGRAEDFPSSPCRAYVQRVRLGSGGYDSGGAYWGLPDDLWCGFDWEGTMRLFVRAQSRQEAKAQIKGRVKTEVRFYR